MGGGGNDDYRQQQAEVEAKKQAARDALNLQFGVAPTGGSAPTREQFTTWRGTPGYVGSSEAEGSAPAAGAEYFDQAGYDKALTDWNGREATAAGNKTARDALYTKVRDDAFTAGKRGLDEQHERAGRDLKFELFAKGFNGGSVDVDQNALLGRTYDQGLLDLGAKADAARADMRGNDESTRLGLLQSIDAGMDQGSALSSALSQMSVNSDRAAASAAGTSLGDLFDDGSALYVNSQRRKGKTDATQYLASLFSTQAPAAGAGANGVVTSTR